jgi:hypothetical protein
MTPPKRVTLKLSAPVVRPAYTESDTIDLATAQQWLGGVSHTTVKNYVAKGMPVERLRPRPRFRGSDVILWFGFYEHLKRMGGVAGRVSIEDARNWHLARQYRTKEEPLGFALVPLAHDHPLRERQLRIAAAGRVPVAEPPNEDEENEHE